MRSKSGRSAVVVLALVAGWAGLCGARRAKAQPAAEELPRPRLLELPEQLASGYRANVAFINETPPFRVAIPGTLQGQWYFMVLEDAATPFYIVRPTTLEQQLPYVSSMVERISLAAVPFRPEDVFKLIAEDAEAWERRSLPDLVVTNPGQPLKVNGLPAYERQLESEALGVVFHKVYILCDDHLIEMELNARRETFEQDDREFMQMVRTLAYVTGRNPLGTMVNAPPGMPAGS